MSAAVFTPERLKYLGLLAEGFPNMEALYTEIMEQSAILSLPKGTEHFMSDIHGEYEAFCHIMNNCSGVIREKVNLWLGENMTGHEVSELCTLIYYPQAKLKLLHQQGITTPEWYRRQIDDLVQLVKMLSSKHSRMKVRKVTPPDWAFIIDELLHAQSDDDDNRLQYRRSIVDTMTETGSGDSLISALATLIKHLAVDRLHVLGDIFDRGPRADSIIDILMQHPSIDIEWGNHDVLWMGAAGGCETCIAGVVRNSLAYNNTEILERGYGIPLRALMLFAEKLYPDLDPTAAALNAITIIMFKLEGQLIRRNPDFGMEDRLLLHRIHDGTVEIDGTVWPVKLLAMPTVKAEDPYALTEEEARLVHDLRDAFLQSYRLREHIAFLYRRGWLYRCFNGNLLLHGCVPLNEDGSLLKKRLAGKELSGRALMDHADQMARRAFYTGRQDALDFMWYLWCGTDSPLCGRKIKTFQRFFIADKAAWEEPRNPYYTWYNQEEACVRILREFGLEGADSRIINGHTPIRVIQGESPLKAGGRLVVIDGGFCRAYQKTTGIAGYTLISNSHGMRLMSHQPFTSLNEALRKDADIQSQSFEFARYSHRLLVRDTDNGRRRQEKVTDLKDLLTACREGLITLH